MHLPVRRRPPTRPSAKRAPPTRWARRPTVSAPWRSCGRSIPGSSGSTVDPARVQEVRDGIDALGRLHFLLRRRVQNHDDWQAFDFELARIEDDLEKKFHENFRWSWEEVAKKAG